MTKYEKYTDCPKYKECVKTADLRIERRRCPLADISKKSKDVK